MKHGRGTYRLAASAPYYATARQLRGTVSHLSAVSHWKLDLLVEPVPVSYVTVPPSRSRVQKPPRVRVFYRAVPQTDRVDGVTSIVRTLLDCLRDCPLPDALAAADSAVRLEKVTKTELVEAAALLKGPKSAWTRQAVAWVDARAASAMESALRGILLDAQIFGFEPQFAVGRAHADLGHARARVLIEADSMQYHAESIALMRDAERYNEFAAAGYVLLRFAWWHIMDRREWVADVVRRTLARRNSG